MINIDPLANQLRIALGRPDMPSVLFNATTIIKGGALQNVFNFLKHVLVHPAGFEWSLAISPAVQEQLCKAGIKLPERTEVFPVSPARSLSARQQLAGLERALQPDLVFTFNGPAYVKFTAPHLLGCTEPWVTHAGLDAYRSLKFPLQWLEFWLITQYKRHWFRSANRWVMQTESSRQGLHRRLGIPLDRIHVVSNSCGAGYFQRADTVRAFPSRGQKVRIFCFSAAYRHKNLKLLPAIAAQLERIDPSLDFDITTTLPDCEDLDSIRVLARQLRVEGRLVNLGPIPVAEGPSTYERFDLLLLPTVLETFSATYPEAMAMGLPIVTSDLDFARDVCGNAALYFDPVDAHSGAATIARLLADPSLWASLVAQGKQQLKRFPDPAQKSEGYLSMLNNLLGAKAA